MSTSIMDIMGPVMVGPSSSHTAGAVNLGRMVGAISGRPVEKVVFKLHGSFAKTCQGHGTDRALLGGILGFKPDDIRIKEAFSHAQRAGLKYEFQTVDLKGVHPNTVIFAVHTTRKKANGQSTNNTVTIQGSSRGGGEVEITKINDYQVSITGHLFSLWIVHLDRPGILGEITTLLGRENLNIASLINDRDKEIKIASTIIKLDQKIPTKVKEKIKKLSGIKKLHCIPTLK